MLFNEYVKKTLLWPVNNNGSAFIRKQRLGLQKSHAKIAATDSGKGTIDSGICSKKCGVNVFLM